MPANIGKRAPYKYRTVEQRGVVGKEPRLYKGFWTVYNMDQVMTMTPEELDQAIDKFIDDFAYRQTKNNKRWDFPLLQIHTR
jgi:hypothetical protein